MSAKKRWGTAEGGTPPEPLPNTTQARIDTYLRCIQTGFDTNQNPLFLQSNRGKRNLSTCPEHTVVPDARPPMHFCGNPLICSTTFLLNPKNSWLARRAIFLHSLRARVLEYPLTFVQSCKVRHNQKFLKRAKERPLVDFPNPSQSFYIDCPCMFLRKGGFT